MENCKTIQSSVSTASQYYSSLYYCLASNQNDRLSPVKICFSINCKTKDWKAHCLEDFLRSERRLTLRRIERYAAKLLILHCITEYYQLCIREIYKKKTKKSERVTFGRAVRNS